MVNNALIHHHITLIDFIITCVIKHLLINITDHIFIQPFSWFWYFNKVFIFFIQIFNLIECIKILFIDSYKYWNSIDHHFFLFINPMFLLIIFIMRFFHLEIHIINDFIDHIAHVHRFKLATHISSNVVEPRFEHK